MVEGGDVTLGLRSKGRGGTGKLGDGVNDEPMGFGAVDDAWFSVNTTVSLADWDDGTNRPRGPLDAPDLEDDGSALTPLT